MNYVTLQLLISFFVGMINHNLTQASASEPSIKTNAAGDLSTGHGSRDLMSGKAFDNGCICQQSSYTNLVESLLSGGSSSCKCFAPQLQPEIEFVNALMDIGVTLGGLETKEQRSMSIQYFLLSCFVNSIIRWFIFL